MRPPQIVALAACLDRHEAMIRSERGQEAKRLLRHGWKAYSQNDEDGLIAEIFARIGPGGKRFVEFGVENGLETNTTYLLMTGWTGLWLEANAKMAAKARENFGSQISNGSLNLKETVVTPDNIESLIAPSDGAEIDLLSIDIDYHDYWVWKALTIRPRVVVIEYNASIRPPAALTAPYQPEARWNKTNFYGASLSALEKLGREKGYSLVGCCYSGVNAFFVRDDLVEEHFCGPFTAENHFEPPRYWMRYSSGHPPGGGVYQEV